MIAAQLDKAIAAAHSSLSKAGLSAHDVERIVFVGGPTHYKPLRDKVASTLGIAPSTDVNPMTAVAEGAAVFAESIDWNSQSRGRKSARGGVSAQGSLGVSLSFLSRTPDTRTRLIVKLESSPVARAEFQVDSLDNGWSSGRMALKDGATAELILSKPGDNTFKIFVFDAAGGPVTLEQNRVVITRTAASVDAIPASHSLGVEVKAKLGGRTTLAYLVREGDPLPKKGRLAFKAEESLKAGSAGALHFKLWEGEITDPISHNRFIGLFAVRGSDFDTGAIPAGGDLFLDYEVRDSGAVALDVTVPSISGSFKHDHNFYSRQEGQVDYNKAAQLIQAQASQTTERLNEISEQVQDERLDRARDRLDRASSTAGTSMDSETAKQALDDVQEARRLLAETRQGHRKEIRQVDLDHVTKVFDEYVRQFARTSEASAFDNLVRTGQRDIDNNSEDFESHLDDLRSKSFSILWRQDWFVIDRFKKFCEQSHLFIDTSQHARLATIGREAMTAGDLDRLRAIVAEMHSTMFASAGDDEILAGANIVLG